MPDLDYTDAVQAPHDEAARETVIGYLGYTDDGLQLALVTAERIVCMLDGTDFDDGRVAPDFAPGVLPRSAECAAKAERLAEMLRSIADRLQ